MFTDSILMMLTVKILKEFVKRGVLKGTFFTDIGINTDDYMGIIDAVFVEN
jgi:hypothetical protein